MDCKNFVRILFIVKSLIYMTNLSLYGFYRTFWGVKIFFKKKFLESAKKGIQSIQRANTNDSRRKKSIH